MNGEWQPGGNAWEEMMEMAREIGNAPGEAPKPGAPSSNVVSLKGPPAVLKTGARLPMPSLTLRRDPELHTTPLYGHLSRK